MNGMSGKLKIHIIGAGISGLSVAYYLNKVNKDLEITLWEKSSDPGGLAGVFRSDNFCLEKFYHHIYRRDRGIQNLVADLNVGPVVWKASNTGAYFLNKFYRLSSPIDLLQFEPLPFIDRIRFGLMMLKAKTIRNWESLDDISAKQFIIAQGGETVYKVVWEPLLRGKFGAYAETVSAAWLWCKLVDRGSRNPQGMEELGYIKGGFGVIFEKIVDILTQAGHAVNFNTPVEKLEANSRGAIQYVHTPGQRNEADVVIGCTQTPDIAKILPEQFGAYRQQLEKIKFLSVVCLILVLEKSLAQFYWNNIYDPESPFIGVIEHTHWTGREDFNNKHIVYISAYVDPQDARLKMDARQLLEHYFPYIKKMFPQFDRSILYKTFLWTAPYAQPIVEIGYRKLTPDIRSSIKNLLICTMAQIYPHDRQVSNGVEMGEKTANQIIETMGRSA